MSTTQLQTVTKTSTTVALPQNFSAVVAAVTQGQLAARQAQAQTLRVIQSTVTNAMAMNSSLGEEVSALRRVVTHLETKVEASNQAASVERQAFTDLIQDARSSFQGTSSSRSFFGSISIDRALQDIREQLEKLNVQIDELSKRKSSTALSSIDMVCNSVEDYEARYDKSMPEVLASSKMEFIEKWLFQMPEIDFGVDSSINKGMIGYLKEVGGISEKQATVLTNFSLVERLLDSYMKLKPLCPDYDKKHIQADKIQKKLTPGITKQLFIRLFDHYVEGCKMLQPFVTKAAEEVGQRYLDTLWVKREKNLKKWIDEECICVNAMPASSYTDCTSIRSDDGDYREVIEKYKRDLLQSCLNYDKKQFLVDCSLVLDDLSSDKDLLQTRPYATLYPLVKGDGCVPIGFTQIKAPSGRDQTTWFNPLPFEMSYYYKPYNDRMLRLAEDLDNGYFSLNYRFTRASSLDFSVEKRHRAHTSVPEFQITYYFHEAGKNGGYSTMIQWHPVKDTAKLKVKDFMKEFHEDPVKNKIAVVEPNHFGAQVLELQDSIIGDVLEKERLGDKEGPRSDMEKHHDDKLQGIYDRAKASNIVKLKTMRHEVKTKLTTISFSGTASNATSFQQRVQNLEKERVQFLAFAKLAGMEDFVEQYTPLLKKMVEFNCDNMDLPMIGAKKSMLDTYRDDLIEAWEDKKTSNHSIGKVLNICEKLQ